jgi:hypothetical protein
MGGGEQFFHTLPEQTEKNVQSVRSDDVGYWPGKSIFSNFALFII